MGLVNKQDRAIELRDLALSVVKARGAWQGTWGGAGLLTYRDGGLIIAYRSPFQQLPQPSGEVVRKAMAYGVMPPKSLPYGLDIWAPRKVLNIEWSDAGDIAVRDYKAGPWEQELERLAAEITA